MEFIMESVLNIFIMCCKWLWGNMVYYVVLICGGKIVF